MRVLPPGTLLQLMYLRARLRGINPGSFIEVGPGSGEITQLLLDYGWTGTSYDLEETTITALKQRFTNSILNNRFTPINEDFLSPIESATKKVDLVISSMVMEHLDTDAQHTFMKTASAHLSPDGIVICFVPASPAHWGIEDEIAGHFRRYTRDSISELVNTHNWQLLHIAGLTFPISNILLPLSNFLVNRSERSKLNLSPLERTKKSGNRKVKYKTYFPSLLKLLFNRFTMLPAYLLQNLFRSSNNALVLYFEARPFAGDNQ